MGRKKTATAVVAFPKRTPIAQSIRFAVFKRDAFTCQYCGAKAPDVLLHVDHIKPVADGGENDAVNLVTSCVSCNLGKGAEPLSDNSVIEKQRKQLEELTERRNQLQMMLEWREGLASLTEDHVIAIQNEFLRHAPFQANETGIKDIKKWLAKYSFTEIAEAISKAFLQYLDESDEEKLSASWNRAFRMVPRLVEVQRRGGYSPDKMRIFYIRGILRNRLRYVDERNVIHVCEDAVSHGVTVAEIEHIAKHVRSWTMFCDALDDLVCVAMGG